MLSARFRFHSRGGVRFTYKNGRSIRGQNLSVIFAPNARHKQRFAVVVSKKVAKSAVVRNRIRRRIYESIRLELPHFKPACDLIFTVYSSELSQTDFNTLRLSVRNLLNQIQA